MERTVRIQGGRRRLVLALGAGVGVALFAWTIWSVGPRALAGQLRTLAPVLWFILILAGIRFLLQAAGWRLAMPVDRRPLWREAFAAVVAGEAAGYFAWGPVSREPTKALLVGHRVPEHTALRAAMVERTFYSLAAGALIVGAVGLFAIRFHFVRWFAAGIVALAIAAWTGRSRWMRAGGTRDLAANAILAATALAQEASNLAEAYLVLAWLGAQPTAASVIVLEGLGRLMNGAVQFIPGKLGVTEAATAAVAASVQIGAPQGLGLALARRARSLIWGAAGILLLAVRASERPPTGAAPSSAPLSIAGAWGAS
jgi:hypothetical protein